MALGYFVLALVFLAVIVAFGSIKIVPQGHEFTVQRFGRYTPHLKPGISILTPFMEGIGRRINMMGTGHGGAAAGWRSSPRTTPR